MGPPTPPLPGPGSLSGDSVSLDLQRPGCTIIQLPPTPVLSRQSSGLSSEQQPPPSLPAREATAGQNADAVWDVPVSPRAPGAAARGGPAVARGKQRTGARALTAEMLRSVGSQAPRSLAACMRAVQHWRLQVSSPGGLDNPTCVTCTTPPRTGRDTVLRPETPNAVLCVERRRQHSRDAIAALQRDRLFRMRGRSAPPPATAATQGPRRTVRREPSPAPLRPPTPPRSPPPPERLASEARRWARTHSHPPDMGALMRHLEARFDCRLQDQAEFVTGVVRRMNEEVDAELAAHLREQRAMEARDGPGDAACASPRTCSSGSSFPRLRRTCRPSAPPRGRPALGGLPLEHQLPRGGKAAGAAPCAASPTGPSRTQARQQPRKRSRSPLDSEPPAKRRSGPRNKAVADGLSQVFAEARRCAAAPPQATGGSAPAVTGAKQAPSAGYVSSSMIKQTFYRDLLEDRGQAGKGLGGGKGAAGRRAAGRKKVRDELYRLAQVSLPLR
eukprot:TRINITY_DN15165_c0_g1_i1.p1 TRINITY_DN15165_c0_g1~~TRINITY_DN15165_c0_g1_i1.p1  ORF type:complete len:501 (+),score=92.10 TRINITY_DN15165_c0_g1_i1:99-1601(+)